MKNAGMAAAVALVGVGLITIGLGNFTSRATAVPMVQSAHPNIVGVALDPSQSSGRWKSRLLAVQGNGKILYLDTKLPVAKWVPFQYSP